MIFRRLQKVSSLLIRFETVLSAICLLGFTITCTLQVLTRFVIHVPMPWLEECSRYLLVWMTLAGAPALTAQGKGISIDFMPELIKNKWKFDVSIILNAFVLACWACFGFFSFRLINKAVISGQVSVMLRIPFSAIYSILLIAAVLGVFHSACNMVEYFNKEEE